MPHQRKARTRFTDSFPSRQQRKLQLIRMQIAAEAARIMATESLSDFHTAKRKAAERIGSSERMALPSNLEVQSALLAYQNLYGGSDHARNLHELRQKAVEVMHLLDAYSPRLTGPVLDGTAGQHTRITLHLFCDQRETLVLDFLERLLPFKQEQKRIRSAEKDFQNVPVFLIKMGESNIELILFPPVSLRQAPLSPVDDKPQQRVSAAELEKLLQLDSTAA